MERIFAPWRYEYVSQQIPEKGCIFCNKKQQSNGFKTNRYFF